MHNNASVRQPLRGKRFAVTMPDTLALAERAALADTESTDRQPWQNVSMEDHP